MTPGANHEMSDESQLYGDDTTCSSIVLYVNWQNGHVRRVASKPQSSKPSCPQTIASGGSSISKSAYIFNELAAIQSKLSSISERFIFKSGLKQVEQVVSSCNQANSKKIIKSRVTVFNGSSSIPG